MMDRVVSSAEVESEFEFAAGLGGVPEMDVVAANVVECAVVGAAGFKRSEAKLEYC